MRQPFKTIYGVLMPVADMKPLAFTAEAQRRRERKEPQRTAEKNNLFIFLVFLIFLIFLCALWASTVKVFLPL